MTIRILLVTELELDPPYGGQFIRCRNIIDSLCRHFSVIVLAPKVDSACKLVTQVQAWHHLPSERHSALPKANSIRYRLTTRPAWETCLKRIYQQHKPQITWFDYGHWGQYTALAREYGTQTIMGTHNTQADLARQEYQVMPYGKARVVQWLRCWAQRNHEQRFFNRFDRIVSVSEADRRFHAQFVGDERSVLISNYVNEADYALEEPVERADNLVILTGNFGSFQNSQGLGWFLKQVWPDVRRQIPQAQLQLVGRGSDRLIKQLDQHPNVTCIGETPRVAPYLRRAAIAAVPLLHGSGTRFKILEAFACKTPVVSTTLGAQGLDLISGENIMLADTGPDFAQAIVSLLKHSPRRSRLAQNSSNILRNQYGFDANTQRIRQLVMEMMSK
ncbi:MAG: glycosyltransferase [Aestuariibacter sp.]|nr:glycosyltransferase [Aestuariibacter sp.]